MVGLRRSQRCSVGDSWWSQAATSCVLLVGLQATAEQLFIRLQRASHAQSSRTYRAAPMQVDSTVGHPSEPCCMLALRCHANLLWGSSARQLSVRHAQRLCMPKRSGYNLTLCLQKLPHGAECWQVSWPLLSSTLSICRATAKASRLPF